MININPLYVIFFHILRLDIFYLFPQLVHDHNGAPRGEGPSTVLCDVTSLEEFDVQAEIQDVDPPAVDPQVDGEENEPSAEPITNGPTRLVLEVEGNVSIHISITGDRRECTFLFV